MGTDLVCVRACVCGEEREREREREVGMFSPVVVRLCVCVCVYVDSLTRRGHTVSLIFAQVGRLPAAPRLALVDRREPVHGPVRPCLLSPRR
jgi:hypothetical protein